MEAKREEIQGKSEVHQLRQKIMDRNRKEQHHQIFQERRKELRESNHIQQIEPVKEGEVIQKCEPVVQVLKKVPDYGYVRRMNLVQSYTIFNNSHHLGSVFTPIIVPPIPQQNIYFQKKGIVVYKKLLGSGASSKVWQGMIRQTNQKIAAKQVKILQINELKCLRELQSPHILKIVDILDHSSKVFIILQYCQRNLREQLIACNYQFKIVMKYFQEIIIGMDELQSKNIIHRDLKFENILVKNGKIKIADFGLAKFLGEQLQVQSRRCGTPYTMAPQIFLSKSKGLYTTKSDIWALGIILHEMLYGIHPFECSKNYRRRERVQVKKKFGVLDKIIDQCLQFTPSYRIGWEDLKHLFGYYLQDKNSFFVKEFGSPVSIEKQKHQQEKRLKRQQRRKEYFQKKYQKEKEREHHRQRERTPRRQRKFQQKQMPLRKKFQQDKIMKNDQHKRDYRFRNIAPQKPKMVQLEVKKQQIKPVQFQLNQIIKKPQLPLQVRKHPSEKFSIQQFTVEMMTITVICTCLYCFFC